MWVTVLYQEVGMSGEKFKGLDGIGINQYAKRTSHH